MEFDRFTVCLLLLRPDAPELDEAAEYRLQDAHMAHLAEMHEKGHLLAAGPILGAADRRLRGLSIYRVPPEEARSLADEDPGVREGRYTHEVYAWLVPAGAVSFAPARFPHSQAELG